MAFETSYSMAEASEARFSIPVASKASYYKAEAYEMSYSTAYVSEARDVATDVSDRPLRLATLRNRNLSQLLYSSGLLDQSLQHWLLRPTALQQRSQRQRPATR